MCAACDRGVFFFFTRGKRSADHTESETIIEQEEAIAKSAQEQQPDKDGEEVVEERENISVPDEGSGESDDEVSDFNHDGRDNDILKTFKIDSTTIEDYGNNLKPENYCYYDSGLADFHFYYPDRLFCAVTMDETKFTDDYGENIRTITFSGSKGSKLIYSISKRTDNLTIKELTNQVHSVDQNKYHDMSDIFFRTDETGQIIMVGFEKPDENYNVYDLIKVDDNYVQRMVSFKPKFESESDRLQYAYVTENEYRMCGFSGSSKATRSYEDYLQESE